MDKPITDIKPIKIANENQIPKSGEIVTTVGFGNCVDSHGKTFLPTKMQEADIPIQDSKIAKDPKYKVQNFDERYDLLAGTITGKRVLIL